MNNKPETPFVNVMIYPGQYALYFVQENGKLIRIEQVATSKRPYEIFFDYANRPYSIIKRFDDSYTNGNARLYLVNNRDGSVPAECKYGTEEIRYCTTFGDIYFCPICQNGKSQSKNVVHMPRFGAVKTAEKLPNPLLGNHNHHTTHAKTWHNTCPPRICYHWHNQTRQKPSLCILEKGITQ